MKDKIMVFIPMYNCAKQIVRVLDQFYGELEDYISQIVIVNNRSTDNGEEAVRTYLENRKDKRIPVLLLRNDENYGLGGSHKVAFQYAMDNGFDYVIVLHGDDQGHIENLLPYLKSGEYRNYDCFLGARFKKGAELDGYSKFRTFGNVVYNLLFSAVVHQMIYDLGSGLNMYRVDALRSKYYLQFKDNLVFNYCMILGSAYCKQKLGFFPIRWSEDDQVSNVKMVNQAIVVLKLLFSYFVNKEKFMQTEHRDKVIADYTAQVVYSTQENAHEKE